MKVLDVASLQTGIADTKADIETKQTQIEAVQRAVRDFHSLDGALKGQGGDAIRGFYKDTHEPFLIFLHQSLTNYSLALEEVSTAINSFESDSNGYVSQSYLEGKVTSGFDKVGEKAKELVDEANEIKDSVKDIVTIPDISESELMDSVSDGKDKVSEIVEKFVELDKEGTTRLEATQSDLATMETFLSEMSTKFDSSASISSYNVASTREMTSIKTIRDGVYSEGVPTEEIEKAKEVKDSVLKDADACSKKIGNRAYTDFKNGEITESKYNDIMSTLNKIQTEPNEDELNEDVSENFLEYLSDNKIAFIGDTTIDTITEYAETHGSLKLGGMIQTFRGVKGDNFVMLNPKSVEHAKPFLNPKTQKWAVNAGKWGGRVATPIGFGTGWYDDVQNNGKTHGQAIAHNSATTGVGFATSALLLASFANPGGLAILGIAMAGVGVAMLADFAYKNNKTVEKSVDYVGDRLSDIGQGIKSFFSSSHATNIHSPGYNAP